MFFITNGYANGDSRWDIRKPWKDIKQVAEEVANIFSPAQPRRSPHR
jgi:hypothetical protein